jgi:hypothetical protein
MNLRRHLAAVLSVQSSRRATSVSLSPSAASSTTLARTTSRCARVYCPARRRSSRSSVSLKVIAASAITSEIRRPYANSSRTYLREPVLGNREGAGQHGDDRLGLAGEPAPGDPDHAVAARDQVGVPAAVALERTAR